MSEKQPLVQGQGVPNAPPPAYQPPQTPPGYSAPYAPPTQAPYGGVTQQQTSNTTVFVQPTQQTRVLVDIKPPNYVVLSVITMLFFCWIFGLIALLVGLQVDSAWLSGDRDGARRHSRQARLLNIIGMIAGVCLYVTIVVVSVSVSVTTAQIVY